MKKSVIIAVVILIGVIAALSYLLKIEKVEVTRLTGNQRSLLEDVTFYRTKTTHRVRLLTISKYLGTASTGSRQN